MILMILRVQQCLAMESVLLLTPISMDIKLGPSCVHHRNFAIFSTPRENAVCFRVLLTFGDVSNLGSEPR